jgi:hypothetical protein
MCKTKKTKWHYSYSFYTNINLTFFYNPTRAQFLTIVNT